MLYVYGRMGSAILLGPAKRQYERGPGAPTGVWLLRGHVPGPIHQWLNEQEEEEGEKMRAENRERERV